MPPEYFRTIWAGGVDQVESLQQFIDTTPTCPTVQVVEIGHQQQVLPAAEQEVHGRELTGDTDDVANGLGLPVDIKAGDVNVAGVGADERREDLHSGRLAGTVGAEQREDRPLGDVEVDAVEDDLVAE